MGKQSTRENKTIYQLCREAQGLTREKASELMPGLSASRIEKFEYELRSQLPTISFRWQTATNVRICATTTVPTNAPSANGMCRKWKSLNFPISFWKPLPA